MNIFEVSFVNNFKRVRPEDISDNMLKLIAKDWVLITAGDKESYNMMTANWAGVGFLWRKNVCFVFIRPSRYTFEFTEKNDAMSLCFFGNEYRDLLNFCGNYSGRDVNKMDCPVTPFALDDGAVAFEEARIIFDCEKISTANLRDFEFIDKSILSDYTNGDFHKLYICEIKNAFVKE